MNPMNNLPRPIESIIKDNIPKAIAAYTSWQEKEKSILTLNNHKAARTVPRSILIQSKLVIPNYLKQNAEDVANMQAAENTFKLAIETFQTAAIDQMIIVAKTAAARLRQNLDRTLQEVSKEIIDFQCRLLKITTPTAVNNFELFQNSYPILENLVLTSEIEQCLHYISEWTKRYEAALTDKIGIDISRTMMKEKSRAAKQAAEEMIIDDADNMLIRDLVRKEMAPLRKAVNHLNSKTEERRNSSRDKNKKSSLQSKPSSKGPPGKQVADKNGRQKQGNLQNKKESVNQQKGRNKPAKPRQQGK